MKTLRLKFSVISFQDFPMSLAFISIKSLLLNFLMIEKAVLVLIIQ